MFRRLKRLFVFGFFFIRGSNRSTTIDINITCGSGFLEIVSYYKYLGVILDENLTWEHHILHITKKVSQKIGALARASQQLSINAKRTFYLSVLASDIEHGSNAFYSSLSTAFKEKLVQLSKRGVRAIFKAPPWTPSAPLYEQLNIATPLKRFEYKMAGRHGAPRPPIDRRRHRNCFPTRKSSSISEKVNISWGHRSVDALFTCVDLHVL